MIDTLLIESWKDGVDGKLDEGSNEYGARAQCTDKGEVEHDEFLWWLIWEVVWNSSLQISMIIVSKRPCFAAHLQNWKIEKDLDGVGAEGVGVSGLSSLLKKRVNWQEKEKKRSSSENTIFWERIRPYLQNSFKHLERKTITKDFCAYRILPYSSCFFEFGKQNVYEWFLCTI